MGKLIAQMLGKTELPLADDGRVTLTAEERASVVNTYGEEFTRMLEETDFSTDDTEANSQELFDAAVNHVAEARIKPLNAQIKTLQESINALAKEPEDDPTAQAVARTNEKRRSA